MTVSDITVSPKELAAAIGISSSYASQILTGTRNASTEVALAAFRAFGVRLGLLAEMTEADLEKLCACVHAPADAASAAPETAGKCPAITGGADPIQSVGDVA